MEPEPAEALRDARAHGRATRRTADPGESYTAALLAEPGAHRREGGGGGRGGRARRRRRVRRARGRGGRRRALPPDRAARRARARASPTPSRCSMSVVADLELTPGLDEVRELAREHNLVPLRHTFIADCETPCLGLPQAARRRARRSCSSRPSRASASGAGRSWASARARRSACRSATTPTPTPRVAEELGRYRIAPLEGLPPFAGGAVGMFGYDLVRSAEPTRGGAQPRRGRHPRPRADDHRRAGGVRPPAPRGDRARERARRGRGRGARLRGRPPAAIAEVKERLAGPVPQIGRGPARAARVRVEHRVRRLRRGGRARQGVHPRGRRLPGRAEPALDRRLPGRTPSRSTAACARSTRARTCTSSTSRTSRWRAPRPSRW